jgi:hypothetical protein
MKLIISRASGSSLAGALLLAGLLCSTAIAVMPSRPFGEFTGVVHSGGKYTLPTRVPAGDYLNEGADRIADLGSRTIKVWLTPSAKDSYPIFSTNYPWPTGTNAPANLMAMLQTTYYQDLLNRPEFNTYVFVASEFTPKLAGYGYTTTTWKDGLSTTERSNVVTQFSNVTKWLLSSYSNTGKTFIFQNWEGDNDLGFKSMTNPRSIVVTNTNPITSIVEITTNTITNTWEMITSSTTNADYVEITNRLSNMISWLNARQEGVAVGRLAASNAPGVRVYNAAEINFNPGTDSSLPVPDQFCMVNAVVPSLTCDLYSWSNWASKEPGKEINVIRGLDYLRAMAPTNSTGFGVDNIYMGEFGAYEAGYMGTNRLHSAASDATLGALIDKQLAYAWRWGALHAVQWACYDNGLRADVTDTFDPANPSLLTETNFVGTWLVRARASATNELSYSFTSAYGRLAHLNGRQLHDDSLANLTVAASTSGGLSVTTSVQPWAQKDRSRVYRTTTGTTAWLTYEAPAPIVDWNIRAFLLSATTAAGRVRGYTSLDGLAWSPAFDFTEIDSFLPDPVLAPTWQRVYLGPPAAGIPSGTRFLRIELYGSSGNTGTQLGHVRLVSESVSTFDDPINSLGLTATGMNSSNLTVSTTASVYSEGDAGRAYRTSTAPGWFVYESRHAQQLRFKVIHYGATIAGKVAARASFDGQIWTPVALAFDPSVLTTSGWYRTWAKCATELPEGTRFVVVDILDPANSWSPQIGQAKFDWLP